MDSCWYKSNLSLGQKRLNATIFICRFLVINTFSISLLSKRLTLWD